MQWWNDIQDWFNSRAGMRIFLNAILPFVAIVLAGIIAAAIGRGSARRVIEQQDRTNTGAAVIALIVVGRKAAIWTSLGGDEKQHVDSLMSEADIRVRLVPVNGANLAADWAAHELAAMKKNSASFSFQAEQSLIEYRDRLLSWQAKPRRARKLFSSDLDQWRYDDDSQSAVVSQQQKWATDHVEPSKTAQPVVPATAALPAAKTPVVASAAAPAAVVASAPAVAASPATGTTPVAPTTGSTSVLPAGLADAAPPTVAPMDAPAPAGLSTATPPSGSSFAPNMPAPTTASVPTVSSVSSAPSAGGSTSTSSSPNVVTTPVPLKEPGTTDAHSDESFDEKSDQEVDA